MCNKTSSFVMLTVKDVLWRREVESVQLPLRMVSWRSFLSPWQPMTLCQVKRREETALVVFLLSLTKEENKTLGPCWHERLWLCVKFTLSEFKRRVSPPAGEGGNVMYISWEDSLVAKKRGGRKVLLILCLSNIRKINKPKAYDGMPMKSWRAHCRRSLLHFWSCYFPS